MRPATHTSRKTSHRSTEKHERLEARITPAQKRLLLRAAALSGRSLTDFVVSSAQDAAARTIHEYDIITLSAEDRQVFMDAMLNPPEPNEKLRALAKRFKRA